MYKHLGMLGVPKAKVDEIHNLVDKLIEGIKEELPSLFEQKEEQNDIGAELDPDYDSDNELWVRNIQNRNVNKTERAQWLSKKHDELKLKEYKWNLTEFWE